ncbi:MAG: hypothetical protein IPF63_02380 [Bacteroidetes bacterium]|nr:hypothetical protein [Bacteroidota bacterium]MBP7257363.1 hypothetical protein [Chitinophagales bacterium]
MKNLKFIFVLFVISISCKKESKTIEETPIPTDKVPIVMMHGVLAAGDTYEQQFLRFTSNGYDPRVVYVFDWNSIGLGANNEVLLDKFIDDILEKTGQTQVNLVGHSAGGGLGYGYCDNASRAAKIAHYVHIGSGGITKPAGPNATPIPTMVIWSDGDKVASSGNVEGCTNVELIDKDHYQVATSQEAFKEMYKFFNNNNEPTTLEIVGDEIIKLSGRVITFGENQAGASAKVNIYELDPNTGFRKQTNPDASFVADSKGNWGDFTAKPLTYYEFEAIPKNPTERTIHYYREPFKKSDKIVYLRIFPPKGSIAEGILSGLPKDDEQSVNAFFGANQAIVSGRDVFIANGDTLSKPKFAQDTYTTIAMFLYDNNKNGASDLNSFGAFANSAFLKFVDFYVPATTPQTNTFYLNGRVLKSRNWPSKTNGVSVIVFD